MEDDSKKKFSVVRKAITNKNLGKFMSGKSRKYFNESNETITVRRGKFSEDDPLKGTKTKRPK